MQHPWIQPLWFSKTAFLTWVAFTLTRARRSSRRKLNNICHNKYTKFTDSTYQIYYSSRYSIWYLVGTRVTPHDEHVAMTNNFHIRMKNAINRSSVTPRPPTPEPLSSPYRSLVRAVPQPFLSQHLRYIVPASKYLSTCIVAFPHVWKLFVMATCQSQPFSTASLIYREPLGSRSHFKVRGWHGWVDSLFFLRGAMMHSINFRTSHVETELLSKIVRYGGVTLRLTGQCTQYTAVHRTY
jgi:hypothetical protein